MSIVLIALFAATGAAGITWFLVRSHFAVAIASKDARNEGLQQAHDKLTQQLSEAQLALADLQKANVALQAALLSKGEQLAEQKIFVEHVKADMEKEFRLIAAHTVDQSAQVLREQQESKLTDLLKPFREQIHHFQESVGKHFNEEGKEKTALQKEIEMLHRSSQLLSKQANDLAEALRGSTKQQGDWGEGILERILEHCGLKEGVDYSVQAAERSHDGKAYRPDVVLHMVGGRNLVIDSKVSLNAYWDMCACEDPARRESFLPAISAALRKHVDELHRRPYSEVQGTPGYLVMFVPVEAAYITALQHDGSLWQYAYDKGVLLISPTNLIPFMRMVASLWDRDKKYKNAEAIAKSAGLLYDKLVGFVRNYEKLGAALRTAQTSYDESFSQLASGKGNLLAKAEEMKRLKISNKNDLPPKLAEQATLADGVFLPEGIQDAPAPEQSLV
jgi:DNA recombination protein RmuC